MITWHELERDRSVPELLQLFRECLASEELPPEGKPFWLEEVAVRIIRQHGEVGGRALLELLPICPSDLGKAAIIGAFGILPADISCTFKNEVIQTLTMAVETTYPRLQCEAIMALGHLEVKDIQEIIRPFLNNPSPSIVAAAMVYFQHVCPELAVAESYRLIHSPSALLRQTAIDIFDELEEKTAASIIRQAMHDNDENVRLAAETAVRHLDNL
jgi:hypothetical protein